VTGPQRFLILSSISSRHSSDFMVRAPFGLGQIVRGSFVLVAVTFTAAIGSR